MAKVSRKTVTPKPKTYIVLEMDLQEASALRTVLRTVGGDPVTSDRKYIDKIEEGLAKLGVRENDYQMTDMVSFR